VDLDESCSDQAVWPARAGGCRREARPEPAKGQLLAHVKAAGVGPWDALIREGSSVIVLPLPLILGCDLSGNPGSGRPGSFGAPTPGTSFFPGAPQSSRAPMVASRDLELIGSLGAEQGLDDHSNRFQETLTRLDVVPDTVGGDERERSSRVRSPTGLLVSAASANPRVDVPS